MSKNSLWFPRLSSWMSAVLLLLMTGILSSSAERIVTLTANILEYSPRLFFIASVVAITSPIGIVAYLHHLIQLILDRLDPDGAPDETLQGMSAFIPTLMSWWEGLYAWLVILLGTLLTAGVVGAMWPWQDMNAVFVKLAQLYEMLMDVNKFKYIFNPGTFIWVIIAAYLYQFEHIVLLRARKS